MFATMGRAVALLAAALVVSYMVWLTREWPPVTHAILLAYWAAALIQCGHLIEEYRSGFYRAFPPIVGSDAWSARQFLIFNLVWLVLFALAGVGLARGWRAANVIALFLALGGGLGNGLGHLALALRAGGYFPGAYTAPLSFVAGVVLARALLRPTSAVVQPPFGR